MGRKLSGKGVVCGPEVEGGGGGAWWQKGRGLRGNGRGLAVHGRGFVIGFAMGAWLAWERGVAWEKGAGLVGWGDNRGVWGAMGDIGGGSGG